MKKINEKYCIECGEIIRKNAYICPHCGVKQSGINIDTEKLAQTTDKLVYKTKVGTLSAFILLVIFIRWVARLSIPLCALGGAIATLYYYLNLEKMYYGVEYFVTSISVMIIIPILGFMVNKHATRLLAKFNIDDE